MIVLLHRCSYSAFFFKQNIKKKKKQIGELIAVLFGSNKYSNTVHNAISNWLFRFFFLSFSLLSILFKIKTLLSYYSGINE
jgi:hypothetical protein